VAQRVKEELQKIHANQRERMKRQKDLQDSNYLEAR